MILDKIIIRRYIQERRGGVVNFNQPTVAADELTGKADDLAERNRWRREEKQRYSSFEIKDKGRTGTGRRG